MKKSTDIYSVEYYLQGMAVPMKPSILSDNLKRRKSFKILVKDDVKDSLYLVDA